MAEDEKTMDASTADSELTISSFKYERYHGPRQGSVSLGSVDVIHLTVTLENLPSRRLLYLRRKYLESASACTVWLRSGLHFLAMGATAEASDHATKGCEGCWRL